MAVARHWHVRHTWPLLESKVNTPKIVTEWLTWFRAQPPLFVWGPVAVMLLLWALLAVLS